MNEKVTIHYNCPECLDEIQVTYDPTREVIECTCPECGSEFVIRN